MLPFSFGKRLGHTSRLAVKVLKTEQPVPTSPFERGIMVKGSSGLTGCPAVEEAGPQSPSCHLSAQDKHVSSCSRLHLIDEDGFHPKPLPSAKAAPGCGCNTSCPCGPPPLTALERPQHAREEAGILALRM